MMLMTLGGVYRANQLRIDPQHPRLDARDDQLHLVNEVIALSFG